MSNPDKSADEPDSFFYLNELFQMIVNERADFEAFEAFGEMSENERDRRRKEDLALAVLYKAVADRRKEVTHRNLKINEALGRMQKLGQDFDAE